MRVCRSGTLGRLFRCGLIGLIVAALSGGALRGSAKVMGSPRVEAPAYQAAQSAQAPTGGPALESDRLSDQDKAEIAVVLALKAADGDTVWPGFAAAGIPLILYNARFEFLTGAPELPAGWEAVGGDKVGGRPYGRRAAQNPQAFASKAGEVWAGGCPTLATMNAKGPFRFGPDFHAVIILHEMFHAFEAGQAPERFKRAMEAYQSESRYPFADKEFTAAWAEEGSLLSRALRAAAAAEARGLARKFLEVRRARRAVAGLGAGTLAFERELEWLEGLAEYAEIRFYELAGRREIRKEEIRFGARLPFLVQEDFPRLESQLGAQKGDLRFYLSGMAQARLLDRLAPDWKTKTPLAEVYLEDLLGRAAADPAR